MALFLLSVVAAELFVIPAGSRKNPTSIFFESCHAGPRVIGRMFDAIRAGWIGPLWIKGFEGAGQMFTI